MSSSGVFSEPPPTPVRPTRMPTPRPKAMTGGSMAASGGVQPALELARARPAALAAVAGRRAAHAADRGVAAVGQLVVGQVALGDVVRDVPLGPGDERRDLVQAVLGVPAELGRLGARRRLLAAHAGHPRVVAL